MAGNGNQELYVFCLHKKTLRYSEIRTEMYNITDAVLAATLKELIADGIVNRRSFDEIPPRVEYSLTEKGESVCADSSKYMSVGRRFYKDGNENEMVQCQKCDHRS